MESREKSTGIEKRNQKPDPCYGSDVDVPKVEEKHPKLTEKIEKKKSSYRASVLAKCHDCMGYYLDGLRDCENPHCPLYPHMPFRKLAANFEWCSYRSKAVGKQLEKYDPEAAERARANLRIEQG